MHIALPKQKDHTSCETVDAHVARIPHGIVNSYLIDDPISGEWVLVDAGLRTSANHILRAAMERYGPDARPSAIILTHGHFDHVGALEKLANYWEVPVYAHRLEFPYLTGRCSYPPPDPGVGGGMMSVMSRFFTRGPIDISKFLQELPSNGDVPGLPSWRWIATPGHSPGHISLFHEESGILVAGDAFVTTKQESATAVLSNHQQVNGPPAYFTCDWISALNSVSMLETLDPQVAATGHGLPMRGEQLTHQLRILSENFRRDAMPKRGRYVEQPAVTDENGVVSIPPPLSHPWRTFLGIGLAVIAVGTAVAAVRRSRNKLDEPAGL